VFVHKVGDASRNDNLAFHYRREAGDDRYVGAPEITWIGKSLLRIAAGSIPQEYTGRSNLDGTKIVYVVGGKDVLPRTCSECGDFDRAPPDAVRRQQLRDLPIPSWSRLHVGMKVYLGNDIIADGTQRVCATLAAYRASEDRRSNLCSYMKYGTPARVEGVIPSRPIDWYFPAPLVRLKASSGHWNGVASAIALQPDIPVGTVLVATREEYQPNLNSCQYFFSCGWGPELGDKARVRLLRYYPNVSAGDAATLYVKVLDGKLKGQQGWMYIEEMQAESSLYSGEYALDYSLKPELTTDPI
jgi:hypothetical protein